MEAGGYTHIAAAPRGSVIEQRTVNRNTHILCSVLHTAPMGFPAHIHSALCEKVSSYKARATGHYHAELH